MVFVKKWPFFQLFFLGTIGQENAFNDILERKNTFQGYKNKKFKKSKNWHISKGDNPRFWSKNGHFSNFFFRQYRQEKCLLRYSKTKNRLFFFYDILKRKNAYLGYKKKEVQKVEKLPMVLVRKWPFF